MHKALPVCKGEPPRSELPHTNQSSGLHALWEQHPPPQSNSYPTLLSFLAVPFLLLPVQLQHGSFPHISANSALLQELCKDTWIAWVPALCCRTQSRAPQAAALPGPHCVGELGGVRAFLTAQVLTLKQGWMCAMTLKSSWKILLNRLRNVPCHVHFRIFSVKEKAICIFFFFFF